MSLFSYHLLIAMTLLLIVNRITGVCIRHENRRAPFPDHLTLVGTG